MREANVIEDWDIANIPLGCAITVCPIMSLQQQGQSSL
jgi:hypothetical protein